MVEYRSPVVVCEEEDPLVLSAPVAVHMSCRPRNEASHPACALEVAHNARHVDRSNGNVNELVGVAVSMPVLLEHRPSQAPHCEAGSWSTSSAFDFLSFVLVQSLSP